MCLPGQQVVCCCCSLVFSAGGLVSVVVLVARGSTVPDYDVEWPCGLVATGSTVPDYDVEWPCGLVATGSTVPDYDVECPGPGGQSGSCGFMITCTCGDDICGTRQAWREVPVEASGVKPPQSWFCASHTVSATSGG